MPWVRFDDVFPIHRKVEGLSDGAFRLHVSAIFWCARNQTDGFLDEDDVRNAAPRGMATPEQFVSELTRAGKEVWEWDDKAGGWFIHDFLDYQPSKEQIAADRSNNAARQARFRAAKRNAATNALLTDQEQHVSNALRNAPRNGAPSRPVPSRQKNEETPSQRQVVGARDDPHFDRFWEIYPKRTEKKAARDAWAKVLKAGADPELVIAGAKRYADERRTENPRYTKHPTTWLNRGCWTDEPAGQAGHQGFRNPIDPNAYEDEL